MGMRDDGKKNLNGTLYVTVVTASDFKKRVEKVTNALGVRVGDLAVECITI